MRLSRRVEYALLAMLDLAQSRGDGRAQLREIAQRQSLPEKYLEQLLRPLRSAGLVVSTRGSRGGYELARSPAEISLLEVLEAVDGPLTDHTDDRHLSGATVVIHEVWAEAAGAIGEQLAQTTLGDLVDRCRAAGSHGDNWVI